MFDVICLSNNKNMYENLEYSCNQVLLLLTLQWGISHKPHYSWNKQHGTYERRSDLSLIIAQAAGEFLTLPLLFSVSIYFHFSHLHSHLT